ncbi:MAG: glycerol-3-phosphate dehydrogenase/oxidase [Gallionellaceae bacterium]|nr:glycerol-3-phosphate dehydrogenase/oxidase [Gallionellaceae bacterium]
MKRDFSALAGCQFDLLVCGGGIYGAWTAYDAALRGLRVAIVEQGDWAQATSSASSKLIHGGLRYLETWDFKLVKKALVERSRLLSNAPHRVWPLRFGIPLYPESRIGHLQLKAGLMLYDFLGGNLRSALRHNHFGRKTFSLYFPALDEAMLQGGFTYTDAQTDDARLVLELIAGAMAAGAVCVNYCQLKSSVEKRGSVYHATVCDQTNNSEAAIITKQLVYATGQWMVNATEAKTACRLTKGVHLVLPAVLQDQALLLTAPSDGRVFFMLPWYGRTLLGTTDTDYHGAAGQVTVEEADVTYLLDAANYYLKTGWTAADIINSYAGVRVLKNNGSVHPSAVSRDWELKTAANGTHYSIGGKITSAREDAAVIVDTVCSQLGLSQPCLTRTQMFPWSPQDFTQWTTHQKAQAKKIGLAEDIALWLMRRYGKRVEEVFSVLSTDPHLATRIVPTLPFILADLLCCARQEMVVHLSDLLRRRMPLLILAQLTATELRPLAGLVAPVLGWDEARINDEVFHCHL